MHFSLSKQWLDKEIAAQFRQRTLVIKVEVLNIFMTESKIHFNTFIIPFKNKQCNKKIR